MFLPDRTAWASRLGEHDEHNHHHDYKDHNVAAHFWPTDQRVDAHICRFLVAVVVSVQFGQTVTFIASQRACRSSSGSRVEDKFNWTGRPTLR